MSKKDWRKKFLSTGIPLEYEVIKILNSNKEISSLTPDYSYERKHLNEVKEFSIDLLARQVHNGGYINYLVECKHRSEDKIWLFTPNLDISPYENSINNCIINMDCFHDELISNSSIRGFSNSIPKAFKAIEYNKFSNDFFEGGALRGAYQLLYSIPNLVASEAEEYCDLRWIIEEEAWYNLFELICPILVTNAELRMLNSDLTMTSVKDATDINEISREVDFLSFYINNSKSFLNYGTNLIQKEYISNEYHLGKLENPENIDEKYNEIRNIVYNKILKLKMFTSNILVCNIKYLDELISMIQVVAIDIERIQSQTIRK